MSYLKADNLQQFPGIDHGFGTADSVWPESIILVSQRHTNTVFIVGDEPLETIPVADALLTTVPHKLLGIKTADCLPILLYNPVHKVAGAIHAGWRGLANGVILNTLDKLRSFYGAGPELTYVSIGPGICRNCYEVGSEVAGHINEAIPVGDAFRLTSGGKGLLDTRTIAERQLCAAGVPRSNIVHIPLCTRCSPGFYSHRAGSDHRQVSYIALQ